MTERKTKNNLRRLFLKRNYGNAFFDAGKTGIGAIISLDTNTTYFK